MREAIRPLIAEVRFPRMPLEYLLERVAESGVLSDAEFANLIVAKITGDLTLCQPLKGDKRQALYALTRETEDLEREELINWLCTLKAGVIGEAYWGSTWWSMTIVEVDYVGWRVRITYPGYSTTWDEWIRMYTGVLRPVGYSGPTDINISAFF